MLAHPIVKKTSSCRFECVAETTLFFGRTGRLFYDFYTSRSDDNPVEFSAREYNELSRTQRTEPAAVCTFRRRTWWWYKLDFYTAPENWSDAAVAEAIRRLVDKSDDSKPTHVDERYHARVLGLRGKVTLEDIKAHFRQRMVEYHPDKVASLGAKLRELAEEETKKINAAYEYFCMRYRRNA